MLGGVPHQGGLPGQPARVTRFGGRGGGLSFLHVKDAEWGNPPNRGKQITRERGELFRRFHLQNHQNANEIDSAGDNLSVESDIQANQQNQTKLLPATTTLK